MPHLKVAEEKLTLDIYPAATRMSKNLIMSIYICSIGEPCSINNSPSPTLKNVFITPVFVDAW